MIGVTEFTLDTAQLSQVLTIPKNGRISIVGWQISTEDNVLNLKTIYVRGKTYLHRYLYPSGAYEGVELHQVAPGFVYRYDEHGNMTHIYTMQPVLQNGFSHKIHKYDLTNNDSRYYSYSIENAGEFREYLVSQNTPDNILARYDQFVTTYPDNRLIVAIKGDGTYGFYWVNERHVN